MVVLYWISTVYTIGVLVPTVLMIANYFRGDPEETED